jgi:hypothetical protein
MNTRLLRKIIGLILSALLLTCIVLLAGTTAAAQRRYQRRVVIVQPINSIRTVQLVRPFSTFGPFGRPYHPFWDPYGRYDRVHLLPPIRLQQ